MISSPSGIENNFQVLSSEAVATIFLVGCTAREVICPLCARKVVEFLKEAKLEGGGGALDSHGLFLGSTGMGVSFGFRTPVFGGSMTVGGGEGATMGCFSSFGTATGAGGVGTKFNLVDIDGGAVGVTRFEVGLGGFWA
jgi:hypothetical protein